MNGIHRRQLLLFFGDGIALFVAFTAGFYINTIGWPSPDFWGQLQSYIGLFVIWMILYYSADLYNLTYAKPTLPFLRRLGVVFIAQIITGVLYFYVFSFTSITPKTDLAIIIVASIILLYWWRRFFFALFSKRFRESIVIIGRNEFSQELSREIHGNPQYGLHEPFLVNTVEEAKNMLREHPYVTTVVLAEGIKEANGTITEWYRKGLTVMDIAQAYETFLYKIPVEFIDETWILHKLERRSTFLLTLFEEVIGRFIALVVLILTFPILVSIAIALKIQDGGPLFIRQKRVGKFGASFRLYKFRSMIALDKDGQAEGGTPQWSSGVKDPRITRVGRIIRKLHVDEIPQMWNVLKGDLALVGPRPERPEFVEKLEKEIPHYSLRHIIRPGFTGWAQIKYRYARTVSDSRDKFEYDLYYLKNKNIFLNIGIILKTIQIMFTHSS